MNIEQRAIVDLTAPVMPSRVIEWMRAFVRDVPAMGREGWVPSEDVEDGAVQTCVNPDYRVCWLRREIPYV